ncbi:MAG: hypothetical protein OEW75_16695 [Cyclobacteriaceae bacterium]|nr:hypothetical protein [Cyclobacteriaceae bacterium]
MENQKVSDVIFMNDRNYVNGYKKQARKKKVKKTLAGFGAAAGVYAIGIILFGL